MPVLVTDSYSRAWRAFLDIGVEHNLGGFAVRVLVGVYEATYGRASVSEIELTERLMSKREAVKRAALVLEDRNLVVRTQIGWNGKATVALMPGGAAIARQALEEATR